jgi:hypothetical protein
LSSSFENPFRQCVPARSEISESFEFLDLRVDGQWIGGLEPVANQTTVVALLAGICHEPNERQLLGAELGSMTVRSCDLEAEVASVLYLDAWTGGMALALSLII